MSAEARKKIPPALPRRVRLAGALRSRGLLTSVPILLITTIAVTLNLASPADAATIFRKPLKVKSTGPESAPTPRDPARAGAARPAPTLYRVVEGDTISGVAGRFGLSTASVLALNGLGWSALIFPGQVLTLGTQASSVAVVPVPAVSFEIARYTIQDGDTVGGIAAAKGLSANAVLSANGLDRSSILFPGQVIVLPNTATPAAPVPPAPAPAAEPAPAPAPAPADAGPATYTIATGDTILTVASAAGVSVQEILDANGLGWSSIIYPGQVLAIPAPPTPLSAEMRANAAIIVSVGRAAGVSERGLLVALTAAAQESALRNLRAGDTDSLGLFQQRPSAGWGSPGQVMDPVRASRAFFGGAGNPNRGVTRGLLDVPGWQTMSVAEAAQAVQVSAYPDEYAHWEASARRWLTAL